MLTEIGQKAKETSYVLGKMGTNLKNAGLLAAKILATEDAALQDFWQLLRRSWMRRTRS